MRHGERRAAADWGCRSSKRSSSATGARSTRATMAELCSISCFRERRRPRRGTACRCRPRESGQEMSVFSGTTVAFGVSSEVAVTRFLRPTVLTVSLLAMLAMPAIANAQRRVAVPRSQSPVVVGARHYSPAYFYRPYYYGPYYRSFYPFYGYPYNSFAFSVGFGYPYGYGAFGYPYYGYGYP